MPHLMDSCKMPVLIFLRHHLKALLEQRMKLQYNFIIQFIPPDTLILFFDYVLVIKAFQMRQKGAFLPYLLVVHIAAAVKLYPYPAFCHLLLCAVFQDNLYIAHVECLYVYIYNPLVIILNLPSCLKIVGKLSPKRAGPSEPVLLLIKLEFFLPEKVSYCLVKLLHVKNPLVLNINSHRRCFNIMKKVFWLHEDFSDNDYI